MPGKPKRNPNISHKDQAQWEARWQHAWQLRAEGLTYAEIGRRLGVTGQRAKYLTEHFVLRFAPHPLDIANGEADSNSVRCMNRWRDGRY